MREGHEPNIPDVGVQGIHCSQRLQRQLVRSQHELTQLVLLIQLHIEILITWILHPLIVEYLLIQEDVLLILIDDTQL